MKIRFLGMSLAVLALALLSSGCGKEKGNSSTDKIPPAAITNLAAHNPTTLMGGSPTAIAVVWTAPGDDSLSGRAAKYDLRYSTDSITDGSWGGATAVFVERPPDVAGRTDYQLVDGLRPQTIYYFAIKTEDRAGNWSGLSNVASAETAPPPDTIPPSPIRDLSAGDPGSFTVVLTWTAPGDDSTKGIASRYDIRYSFGLITESNFGTAARVDERSLPKPDSAGKRQVFTVGGLLPKTFYYFAVRTADKMGNWSKLSNLGSAQTLPAEQIPPAAVSDLTAGSATFTTVELTWTAPGDDGMVGTASQYDIRFSTAMINDSSWALATQAVGEPPPQPAGSKEHFTVRGLFDNTFYYFAIKTTDKANNRSALSNIAFERTLIAPDTIPPYGVTTLTVVEAQRTALRIQWDVRGGDDNQSGLATSYDIRYSQSPINDANFSAATKVGDPPVPTAVGTVQSMWVTGLKPATTYYFAMKIGDEVPNWSPISNIASGRTTE